MENNQEIQRKSVIGKRAENQTLRTISADDPFKDTPFFGAGESDSEHITEVPVGGVIAGYFHGLRESRKANNSGSKSWYACIETTDGQKLRLFAPTVLKNLLEREAQLKQYVEVVYMGRREPVDGGKPYHNFELSLGDTLN